MKYSIIFTAIILLVIAGCMPVPSDFGKKQEIKYLRTEVTKVTKEKVDANVVFRDVNHTSANLDNVSADYELFLEGQKVASGQNLKFNFKANDTTEFVIPVEAKYLDLFKTTENLAKAIINGKKTVKYQARTRVTINLMGVSLTIPVNAEGELPMPEIEKPKFKF